MKITIVQYGGDFQADYERFRVEGSETYQAQRYSHECVNALAQRFEVSVLTATGRAYDVRLSNGVRAIGAGFPNGFKSRHLLPFVKMTCPDRLILGSPLTAILVWANLARVRTLATLADSFGYGYLRQNIKARLLARLLNETEWVGNHQVGACVSLRNIGVNSAKIIPWDWPASQRPDGYPARQRRSEGKFELVYVGSVSAAKGVTDLVNAVTDSDNVTLTIVGPQQEAMPTAPNIRFLGPLPNDKIPAIMRNADAIVIPSRHEYPEGLPLTIFEALASRTPIIASDHPMFLSALKHERDALIFPARDYKSLASTISRLSIDSALYNSLSANGLQTWETLQIPVTWGSLINRWLDEDIGWMRQYALSSGIYNRRID